MNNYEGARSIKSEHLVLKQSYLFSSLSYALVSAFRPTSMSHPSSLNNMSKWYPGKKDLLALMSSIASRAAAKFSYPVV